jgi:hypothetical protein
VILGTGGMVGSERDKGRGAWIDPAIPLSLSRPPLLLACVVWVCSVDVESPVGSGGGDPEPGKKARSRSRSLSIVDPEPEKNRGDNQDAGAVADLRFSFSFSFPLSPSFVPADENAEGLVARLYALFGWLWFWGGDIISAYLEGGRAPVAVAVGTDEGGICVLLALVEAALEPIDDRRGLVSGIPNRLCNRIRVEVGCLEPAAESDDDPEGGSAEGGGEVGGEED